MRFNVLIVVVALAIWTSCASKPPRTAAHFDPITQRRTDVSENLLPSPETPREVLWLNMFRDYRNPRNIDYVLELKYMAPKEVGYIEIPPGEALTIIADGKAMRFTGNGSMNRRKTYRRDKNDFVTEQAWYDVKKTDLQALANSNEIKVQVKGNKGLVERQFDEENIANLRAFVARAAR